MTNSLTLLSDGWLRAPDVDLVSRSLTLLAAGWLQIEETIPIPVGPTAHAAALRGLGGLGGGVLVPQRPHLPDIPFPLAEFAIRASVSIGVALGPDDTYEHLAADVGEELEILRLKKKL